MPTPLSKPSSVVPMALVFVTIGALLTVWGLVWMAYLFNNPPERDVINYIDYFVLSTGIVLLVIGSVAGRIGRAAREVEMPPKGADEPQSTATNRAS